MVNNWVNIVSFTLPVKAPARICDTSMMYMIQNVSFGIWLAHTDITLADGSKLIFRSNRITYYKFIDERNLVHCK